MELQYLSAYSNAIQMQVMAAIQSQTLGALLQQKYPTSHHYNNDGLLYGLVIELKNRYLKQAPAIKKVSFDSKMVAIERALGQHIYKPKRQGAHWKTQHEIKIASLFKHVPLDFLMMIVAHELAHLKEQDHNKAFYQLCCHMQPDYHQKELDLRLYLTYLAHFDEPLW
jgi:predicted metal-dependent hydrolase